MKSSSFLKKAVFLLALGFLAAFTPSVFAQFNFTVTAGGGGTSSQVIFNCTPTPAVAGTARIDSMVLTFSDGDVALITPDIITRSTAPDHTGPTTDLEFLQSPFYAGTIPNPYNLPVGYLFLNNETNTLLQFNGYIMDGADQIGWNWAVVNTNNARLTLDPDVSLGTTVLEQDGSRVVIYQKIANPGTSADDWIEVNFEIPQTVDDGAGNSYTVTSIAANAFSPATSPTAVNLQSVVLPSSLTSIGDRAFDGCTELGTLGEVTAERGVFIPAAVNTIGIAPFNACSSLENIYVHALNPFFCSVEGVLYDKAVTELYQYPTGKLGMQFEPPATVEKILESAFEGNRYLVLVETSDYLTTIEQNAFRGSEALVQVRFGDGLDILDGSAFRSIPTLGRAIFTGDIPSTLGTNVFDGADDDFVVNYYPVSTGFVPPPWAYNTQPLNTFGDFEFTTNADGDAVITGYTGTGGSVVVPSFIGISSFTGVAVREIADDAFLGKIGITSVTIPASVNKIGDRAFKGVTTLATVSFGSGLNSIGDEAFYGCNELTQVSISAAITSIGDAAFAACEKLIAIRVNPNNSNYSSATYLNGAGEILFNRTQQTIVQYPAGILQSTYEIPVSVKTIGKRAFEGAMHLSVIEFPNTVTKIEEKAFYNTAALVTVRFGRGITYIGDQAFAGIITPLNAAIFYGTAPDPLSNQPNTSSNYFGPNVFQGALPTFKVQYLAGATGFPAAGANWASYTQVPIAEVSDFEIEVLSNNTVEIIGYTGLTPTITADRSTLPTPNIVVPDRAARLALTNFNTAINTRLPDNTLVLQQDEDLIYILNFPAGVPIWSVFDNSGARFSLPAATALGTVVLEQDGVSKVYYQKVSNPGAVASNWIVVDFRIPNTLSGLPVTSIRAEAFKDNTVINSVVLPSTLTKIGDEAFSGCTNLGGLVSGATGGGLFLPASLTNFGAGAFSSCNQLQQIIAHPSNPAYASQSGVLFNKLSTKLVQFPAGLARTEYTFPQSVTEISASAFEGSVFLAEIEIPDSVKLIGAEAFANSQALAKVVFGTNVAEIGYSAFDSISSLSEAVFFGNAPKLGADVFASTSVEVYYLKGAKEYPDAIPYVDWPDEYGYSVQELSVFNDFEFTRVTGGVRIDGYKGDPSSIRFESDLVPLPLPNQVVEDAAAREALPAGLPIGWNVLELSTNLLWFVESQTGASAGQPARNNWAVRVSEGSRLLLNTTIPVGQTYKEQSASQAMFYQKVAMPGTNESDWIRISTHTLRIPETLAGLPVVSIKDEAFKGLITLQSVVFPNSLKSIGNRAFALCSMLGLPNGFAGNNRGVFIPAGVSSIGAGAFAYCGWLSEIRVSAANKAYSQIDGVLFNKSQTQLLQYPGGRFNQSYTLPSRTTTIADYAFEGSAYLENVEIPASCTEIGAGAFQDSVSLATITVGSGVKKVGDLAFANISGLESITFKGNAPSLLGANVFENLSSSAKIQFNARSTGFNVAPWSSLNLVPVWMSEGSPTSAGFRAFGYVEPADFNNNIGGQFQISVSRSRVATGVLMLGAAQASRLGFSTGYSSTAPAGGVVSYRFRGLMDDTGAIAVSIPRRGQTPLDLDLQFDLLEAPVFFKLNGNSSVTDGTSTANVTAGMIPWSSATPANAYAGNYNMAFSANAGNQTLSPGQGYAGMGVDARTGAARLTGVLGDGTRFTGASWVLGDENATVPLWFPLYSNRGMLVGDVDLGANGSTLSASLLWTKPPGVPRSPDPVGFTDVLLTAAAGSGRYVAPSLSSFNNMVLNFLGEPAADLDFDQTFTVANGRIVPGASNPYLIQAAWNLRGGLVQGTFSQPDPIQPPGAVRPLNRVGRFQGIILSNGEIHGNFVLPNSATRPTEFYGGSVNRVEEN